jgi:hypothetical protein
VGITFTVSGDWDDTRKWLKKIGSGDIYQGLDSLAKEGVTALRNATPVRSGIGASSWDYKIVQDRGGVTIAWTNSDTENGFPVVIMLQYGHGTGTGGYVEGEDFINPAIRPIFDKISNQVWKAVTS